MAAVANERWRRRRSPDPCGMMDSVDGPFYSYSSFNTSKSSYSNPFDFDGEPLYR